MNFTKEIVIIIVNILLLKCQSTVAQNENNNSGCASNPCHPNATCVDDHRYDNFTCSCIHGYTGDGMNCENINECELNSYRGCGRICDYRATCTDTDGSYECTCNEGYRGNGHYCEGPNIQCPRSDIAISFEVFHRMNTLLRRLGCTANHYRYYYNQRRFYYYNILYNVSYYDIDEERSFLLPEQETLSRKPLVADWFEVGEHFLNIVVCRNRNYLTDTCDPNSFPLTIELKVNITVRPNTVRLFPYGELSRDSNFDGILDGEVEVSSPDAIPFFGGFDYQSVYVSSNGIVTFDRVRPSSMPIPFPYGRSRIPVIAPLWMDFDFRNTVPGSAVFYNTYQDEGIPSLGNAILDEFKRRLNDSNFEIKWVAVFTWNEATPYPYYLWQHHFMGRVTFQLVLATDYLQTHAFYLYKSSSLHNVTWENAVVGFDAKDINNYYNLNRPVQELVLLHSVEGNTGRLGEWYFNFTLPPGQATAEQRCLIWARKQTEPIDISSLRVKSCPCYRSQILWDFRFWFGFALGLSTHSNCATVQLSGSQHTLECCYDQFGALIVGPKEGGSYKMYNPLYYYQEYKQEDVMPYFDCCLGSRKCDLYYLNRPYDDCSQYEPLFPSFLFGDPHLETLDRRNFTFNGVGEYILIDTPESVGFDLQARMETLGTNVSGTVMTSIVVKLRGIPAIQIEAGSSSPDVYISGVQYEMTVGDLPLMVTSSGVMSSNLTSGIRDIGDPMLMAVMNEQVSVRMVSVNSVAVVFGDGGSITVSLQNTFLGLSVSLPDSFKNSTSGLLGYFNDDPDDDYRDRDGHILSLSSEQEIYCQFGLQWHLNEDESHFNYAIGDTTYDDINDGYLDHLPVFADDLDVSDGVRDMCQGNPSCIYDTMVTGSNDIGMSTLDISTTNDEIVQILGNSPPTIRGNFTLFARAGNEVAAMFTAEDTDSADYVVDFGCLDDIEGFTCERNGNVLTVRWLNPTTPFPNTSLRIYANDSSDTPTIRTVFVTLCQCNSGSCVTGSSPQYDSNGYYQVPCRCPEFFSGVSCEIDERGCGEFSLCSGSVCINDSSRPSGYYCGECRPGYNSSTAGDRCADVNECHGLNNCSQICTNTEGSYTCGCRQGYSLGDDLLTCEDINECNEGTANCSQVCLNAVGTFVCHCHPGYSLGRDRTTCHLGSCGDDPCNDPLSCVEVDDQYECLCEPGQQCDDETSVCISTDKSVLRNGLQTCSDCPPDTYGVRCSQNCSCGDNGACDAARGCVCDGGWSGLHCDQELNLFPPSFSPDTPARKYLAWNLVDAVIIRVVASDNDRSKC